MDVRIIKLEPMRVASCQIASSTPEKDAWEKISSWAKPKGLLDPGSKCRVYGFNNPNPTEDDPSHGYEFWLTVGPDIEGSDGIVIKDVPGGLYAVTRTPFAELGESWNALCKWVEERNLRGGSQQWLESAANPNVPEENLILDLYFPLASDAQAEETRSEPTIQSMRAFFAAGTNYIGKNEHGEIPAMWGNDFLPRMSELDADESFGRIAFGICRMPETEAEQGAFEYIAALAVKSLDNLPTGMVGLQIPEQTYAVFPAYGLTDLTNAFDYIYSKWLPQSRDYDAVDGPMFELYPETFDSDNATLYIYTPVKPK